MTLVQILKVEIEDVVKEVFVAGHVKKRLSAEVGLLLLGDSVEGDI